MRTAAAIFRRTLYSQYRLRLIRPLKGKKAARGDISGESSGGGCNILFSRFSWVLYPYENVSLKPSNPARYRGNALNRSPSPPAPPRAAAGGPAGPGP